LENYNEIVFRPNMIVFLFLSVYDADMTVSRRTTYVKILFKVDLDFRERR